MADPRKSAKGAVCHRVVEYLDIYPTLSDACGLPKPSWAEGRSITSLLENPDAQWDLPAYTVQTRKWFIGRTVRNERWRYTEWDEGRRGSALFDHENDPHEMTNLVEKPELSSVVAEMKNLLRVKKL